MTEEINWESYRDEAERAFAAAGLDTIEDARIEYLGRKSQLALGLRGVRDRETGMRLNDDQDAARGGRRRARAGARRRGARPAPSRRGDRRHAPGRGAAARASAPDHPGSPHRRGRVPRPWLRGARRPRGRDGRIQLRQARLPADALRALAARHVLLRRDARPAHRDEPVADPHPRGEAAADLHGLDRPRLPARRDHGDALPDLPSVRRARGRQGADARRSPGDAAPRDARALRARHAACASVRTSSRSRSRRSSPTSRAGSAAVPAAVPASSPAGSRWAAPAWSIPRCSRTSASIPEEWGGFAFGCGLERTAQLRHDIPDIRALWEGDLRVLRILRQF